MRAPAPACCAPACGSIAAQSGRSCKRRSASSTASAWASARRSGPAACRWAPSAYWRSPAHWPPPRGRWGSPSRPPGAPAKTKNPPPPARALPAPPVLLVLDEPAAGLRRQEKLALAGLLRKLRGEGLTILLVEHDMDFVMHLVDRLVVMNFGAKLIEGTPAAVRADARVQAAYLGSME